MEQGDMCENCAEAPMESASFATGPYKDRVFLVCYHCGVTNINEVL